MARRDHRKGALPFRFVAIPVTVLESSAYRALPSAARALLVDLLMQYTGRNNGRLSASFIAMQRYGWNSKSKLERAKAALLQAPFVLVTRKGRPPSTSEWLGVTWAALNFDKSMDVDPRSWPLMNFQTLEAGAIDPNVGREKQFLSPRIGGDEKGLPGGIAPETGVMA